MKEVTKLLTEYEARALTERINRAGEELCVLLVQAHEGRAWEALGYSSWREYATSEFQMPQSKAYELLNYGRLIAALTDMTGDSEISEKVKVSHVRPLSKVPEEDQPKVLDLAERIAQREGKKLTAGHIERARQGVQSSDAEPEPSAADFAPDPVAEWERLEEENAKLRELVDELESDDLTKKHAELHDRYQRLEGRLQQEIRTRTEAEKDARYAKNKLRQVRTALGVEQDRDILSAIASLKEWCPT